MAKWYAKLGLQYVELPTQVNNELELKFEQRKSTPEALVDFKIFPITCPLKVSFCDIVLNCVHSTFLKTDVSTQCSNNSHIFHVELHREGSYTWEWYDNTFERWYKLFSHKQEKIEDEYQQHLNGTRTGMTCYTFFGNFDKRYLSTFSVVNFDTMRTECAEDECVVKSFCNHETFKVRRSEKQC